jgi:ABC-type sugar transport system permease subunit
MVQQAIHKKKVATTPRWFSFQQRYAPYLFISPFLLLFATFGFWPIVKSLILSVYATNGPKSAVFVGLANFRFLLSDPDFHTAVRNTAVFAFFSVYLGVLFSVLLVPQYGLLNRALHALIGIPLDTKWLSNPALVMPALVLTSLWMYVGFNMIYFLAALQTVDQELYEAATVDGANAWQQFFAVTVPGIRPVAVFVIITSTIGSFQLFELPYIMLNNSAGPNNAGLTIVMYLYNNGFVTGDLGYASAVGWTLALAVLTISLFQARITGLWRGSGE